MIEATSGKIGVVFEYFTDQVQAGWKSELAMVISRDIIMAHCSPMKSSRA